MTSELITRQNSEMKSFENQLAEIEDDVLLKEVLKLIKRAMNEFLSRNITCVIFYPKFTAEEGELIAHEWIKLAKESLRTGFVFFSFSNPLSQQTVANSREFLNKATLAMQLVGSFSRKSPLKNVLKDVKTKKLITNISALIVRKPSSIQK